MNRITQVDPVETARSIQSGFGELSAVEQRVAVGLYRALSRGEPVAPDTLALELDVVPAVVGESLERWPGVFRRTDGAVVGFWGIAIPEMPHRFEVEGRRLHTWCAWDSLFIPVILGKTAHVTSKDPSTDRPVSLTVRPNGVESVSPRGTVVSLLEVDALGLDDIVSTFCHFIHFFESEESGAAWSAKSPGTFIVSLDDAFRTGTELVRLRYDAVLGAT